MNNREKNKHLLQELYSRLVKEFDDKTAGKIFNLLQDVIGNKRITFNINHRLYLERNMAIRSNFNGRNYARLSFLFNLTEKHIRNIVHSKEDINDELEEIKSKTIKTKERNEEILKQFNGDNIEALAIHYMLSKTRIYQIIKADDIGRQKWNAKRKRDQQKWNEKLERNQTILICRNEEIRKQFHNDNYQDLALRFQLSPGTIYNIVHANNNKKNKTTIRLKLHKREEEMIEK